MKYVCSCGKELKLEDMGRRHKYYNCAKARGGCGNFYGILGKRFYWSVPAIDEFTGEIVYEYTMTADGSYRKGQEPKKPKKEKFKCFNISDWLCPACNDSTPDGGRATKNYIRCKACGSRSPW